MFCSSACLAQFCPQAYLQGRMRLTLLPTTAPSGNPTLPCLILTDKCVPKSLWCAVCLCNRQQHNLCKLHLACYDHVQTIPFCAFAAQVVPDVKVEAAAEELNEEDMVTVEGKPLHSRNDDKVLFTAVTKALNVLHKADESPLLEFKLAASA